MNVLCANLIALSQASHAAAEVASPEQREEFSNVTAETWDYVLHKAFGFRDVKPLGVKRCRQLASKVSTRYRDRSIYFFRSL
jgi:hypothetical protein